MTVGTLTQAYTKLVWGGETLHAYKVGGDIVENIAQNVSVNLTKTDAAPTASFQITASPAGFELFQRLKKEALDQPFEVSFGYLNGSETDPMKFRFAGISLTTGMSPKLQLDGVGTVKGAWTDNKISYTLEKKMPLSSFPDFLKEKCGKGCKDMNFVWKGKAKEVAAGIDVTGNQIGRTPMTILTDTLRPHGIQVQVSDNIFQGEMVLSYSPVKKGELEADKPKVKTDDKAKSKPAERTVYIIGPGLMTNISRTQKFNTGSTSTNFAASPNSPNVAQTNDKAVPQPQNALPQVETTESTNETGGTSGQANPGSANTGSTKAGDDKEATAAIAQGITTTVSFKVLMVPYMVGIKPRDLLAIPSLKGPGDYIEDWEVKSVKYSMNASGGVSIAIQGERPYTGEEALLDSGSLSQVKSTVKGLVTPESWNKFYWIQGPDSVRPLAS